MSGSVVRCAAAGFANGDDLYDAVARLPACVSGFNLLPYRVARIKAWRKRSCIGFLAALCGGVVGALLLQMWFERQVRIDHRHAMMIGQQVEALAPALLELSQWQSLIATDRTRRDRQRALSPQRTRLTRLLDLLAEAARTGVRLTEMQVRETDLFDMRVQLAGLADDADTLAQWAAHLAAQVGVKSVDLEAVNRLDQRSDHSSDAPLVDLTLKRLPLEQINASNLSSMPNGVKTQDARQLSAFRLTLAWDDSLAFAAAMPPDAVPAQASAAAMMPRLPTSTARS